MRYTAKINASKDLEFALSHKGEIPIITRNGVKSTVESGYFSDDYMILKRDGLVHDVHIKKTDDAFSVRINGKSVQVSLQDERTRHLAAFLKKDRNSGAERAIKAPMPGLIYKMLVKDGQEIKKNDPLVIIEAMKMENELRAVADGIIKTVLVKEGQAVDKGAILFRLA